MPSEGVSGLPSFLTAFSLFSASFWLQLLLLVLLKDYYLPVTGSFAKPDDLRHEVKLRRRVRTRAAKSLS